MAVVDADVFQNDEETNLEINSRIKNMPSKKKPSFQYEFCDNVCFSNSGLKRMAQKSTYLQKLRNLQIV